MEAKQLRELFRRCEFLRTVNRYGFVSVQRFYIYAESGLSRKRMLIWIFGATRQCGSIGIGGCDAFMKLCLLSSGCESRPAKGNPPGPVASLAPVPEMGLTMRRHANVRAVGLRPRNLSSFRMPRVLEYLEGNNDLCVSGQGGVHIRRGVRPGHARRGRPSHLGGPRLSSTTSRLCGEPVSRLRRTARLRVQVPSALEA